MLTTELKEKIQSFPPNDFVLTWETIEQMQDAMERAGPLGLVALAYVFARAQEKAAADAPLVLVVQLPCGN